MWVYLIAVVVLIVGVVGSISGAGIFTIILIPIAFIIAAGGFFAALMGRRAQGAAGKSTHESHVSDRPLPHSPRRPTGRAPSTPENLADARRAQQ